MCGAKLPVPQAVAPRPQTPPSQEARRPEPPPSPTAVSGPSILGLSDEPVSNPAYLLEDEESTSHRGRILVLLLLIAIGASAWHWRQDLGTWAVKLSRDSAVAPTQTANSTPPPPAASAATPANAAPAPPATDQAQTGSQPAPAAPAINAASGNPPAAENAAPSGSASPAPSQAAVPAQAPTAPAAESASETEAQKTPPPPAAAKPPVTPAAQIVRASSPAGEGLEAEGEKYLYGSGVPANCNRALKDLLDAAARSNEKAQSVLATMYATGHCVPRDSALAYRWFAKALHQDPSNARLKRDLEVLWNQMTPDERQMAMRSEQ